MCKRYVIFACTLMLFVASITQVARSQCSLACRYVTWQGGEDVSGTLYCYKFEVPIARQIWSAAAKENGVPVTDVGWVIGTRHSDCAAQCPMTETPQTVNPGQQIPGDEGFMWRKWKCYEPL
jgi:hypothetical protein